MSEPCLDSIGGAFAETGTCRLGLSVEKEEGIGPRWRTIQHPKHASAKCQYGHARCL